MLKRTIKIIHRLRVYLLCFLMIGFFYYLGTNPIRIGRYIGARSGLSVSMSTSVPENPINKLALDLQQKENLLAQKEQELNDREKTLNSGHQNIFMIGLGIGIMVLFLLIMLNYYLDYRRRKMSK
jgi:hypothetical protein